MGSRCIEFGEIKEGTEKNVIQFSRYQFKARRRIKRAFFTSHLHIN